MKWEFYVNDQKIITQDESECLELLKDAWNVYVTLPVLHEQNNVEFMRAIHAAQYIVMSRPAFRELNTESKQKG